jgi:hypothetical protein
MSAHRRPSKLANCPARATWPRLPTSGPEPSNTSAVIILGLMPTQIAPPFWQRQDRPLIPYPGVRQIGDTCVLASMAGALNWIAGTQIDVCDLVADFRRTGGVDNDWRFDNVIPLAQQLAATVQFDEYIDGRQPLQDMNAVRAQLRAGSVLILSLRLTELHWNGLVVHRGFHMLSLFDLRDDLVQVWDSNNLAGFLRIDDVTPLATADTHFHQYPAHSHTCLVAHPQHHCLLMSRA